MNEPANEVEALRAERDELRDELLHTRGHVAWVISGIYRQQHYDPDFPEYRSRWMDEDILRRLNQAVGWGSTSEETEATWQGGRRFGRGAP